MRYLFVVYAAGLMVSILVTYLCICGFINEIYRIMALHFEICLLCLTSELSMYNITESVCTLSILSFFLSFCCFFVIDFAST